MNRFRICALSASCFVLGTLLPITFTHAQDSSPNRTYYVIDYMKSKPGQDPFKMERDLWKPLHQERVKNGEITSWSVMEPVLAGPHNYDYITVTGYHSIESYGKGAEASMRAAAEKIWGKDKLQSSMKQTMDARDMLGSEMYVVVDEVSGNK